MWTAPSVHVWICMTSELWLMRGTSTLPYWCICCLNCLDDCSICGIHTHMCGAFGLVWAKSKMHRCICALPSNSCCDTRSHPSNLRWYVLIARPYFSNLTWYVLIARPYFSNLTWYVLIARAYFSNVTWYVLIARAYFSKNIVFYVFCCFGFPDLYSWLFPGYFLIILNTLNVFQCSMKKKLQCQLSRYCPFTLELTYSRFFKICWFFGLKPSMTISIQDQVQV